MMSKLKPNFRATAERLRNIRRLHEAEADDEPGEQLTERLDLTRSSVARAAWIR